MSDSKERQQKLSEARRALLKKRRTGALKSNSAEAPKPTIPKRSNSTPPLASFGQERLWILQQFQPLSTAYNMTNAVALAGTLNVQALKNALKSLVVRHDILRTTFSMQDGNLLQYVHESLDVSLQEKYIAPANVEASIKGLASQPFNLEQAPLLRVALLHTEANHYVLVTVMHHIISDEWSLEVFWRELAKAYGAYLQGNEPDLQSLTISYTDYAIWQRGQAEQGVYDRQLLYWQEHLQGELPLLQLPTDRPRPRMQRYEGGFITSALPGDLSSQLNAISREAGTTLFTTLLAAFQLFLHRYSGQTDILVGTPVTNREQLQTENLMGFFLNTLVFRSDFSQPQSFNDLLKTVHQHSIMGLANQTLPFDLLVDELNPKRDPSYNPIFQVMFVYQDGDPELPEFQGLEAESIQIDAGVSKFDLTLFARNGEENIQLSLEYDSALFNEQTIQRMLGHFKTLLASIVSDTARRTNQLVLLPDIERQQILSEWAQTAASYNTDQCIHHLIEAHAADAIAVRFGKQHLTYGDLNQRANQVAHYLASQGVLAGTPVGLCVERSVEMLIGIVGILKAGGAYVPIDPIYPPDRIQYMLDDAGIKRLLTQTHLLETLPQDKICCIALDNNPALDEQPVTNPTSDATPDHLAYMIYTSGSTGKPKGVRVTHRNLVHSTLARFEYYPHPVGSFLLLSSFGFDSSLVGIFWTLCQGGTLCLPPHQAERDVLQIASLIEEYDVTHLLALPSLYQILLETADTSQLQSLNTVMVAGEACPLPLPTLHNQILPDADLYNEYGPTEGTVWSTVWRIPPEPQRILIGKAIPNMQTYILDTLQQPVPISVTGELYLGGLGITEGYHNRPELTAERFMDNPFGEGKLYRTGDLARYLVDGNIEFLGRVDHQVKISGYRIELSEIETVFTQHPAVTEALVLAVEAFQQPIASDIHDIDQDELLRRFKIHPDAEQILSEIESMSDEAVNALIEQLLGAN